MSPRMAAKSNANNKKGDGDEVINKLLDSARAGIRSQLCLCLKLAVEFAGKENLNQSVLLDDFMKGCSPDARMETRMFSWYRLLWLP
jgi:hypothetical protein